MVEKEPKSVDFHIHYSEDTVKQIIEKAKEKNLRAIALVGRAQISDKLSEYVEYGQSLGIDVISGVEYIAKINDQYTDLIGLRFNYRHPAVQYYFGENNQRQVELNRKVAKKQLRFLEEKGFKLNNLSERQEDKLNDLLSGQITEKAIQFCKIAASYDDNKSQINKLKKDHNRVWQQVYKRYQNRPGYKNRKDVEAKFLWSIYFAVNKEGFISEVLSPAENIIGAIHKADGVVLYSPEGNFDQKIWSKLQEHNIDGVMGWHGTSLEINRKTVKKIRQKGLLILGGSDYNPERNEWKIGRGQGNMFLSTRRYEELIRYR